MANCCLIKFVMQLSDHGSRRHKLIKAAVAGKERISYEDSNGRYVNLREYLSNHYSHLVIIIVYLLRDGLWCVRLIC